MNTSTWTQDVARGLAHPDSVAARKQRAQARSDAEAGRRNSLQHAWYLLERSIRPGADVVQTLHCMLAGLAAQNPLAGSSEAETIELLGKVADQIDNK